jgi:chemotaxis response regulator CheB
VIVLDVEMPRMDGITFLKRIMAERPTPVVICSTLTEKGAETTMAAMAAGAVSIITKPKLGLKDFLNESADELVAAVRAASQANVRRLAARAGRSAPGRRAKLTADAVLPPAPEIARPAPDDRAGGRHRHLHRRHAGARRSADGAAARHAGHRHRAAHAGKIHRRLRRAPEQAVPDRGEAKRATATACCRAAR